MSDTWMPTIKLPMSAETFHQLPRNSAYRYEYLDGKAYLSPRPRHYHALLDLQRLPVDPALDIRPACEENFGNLTPLFAEVFRNIQPFGSLDSADRLEASTQALERTRTGGDGPWVQPASFIAQEDARILGAILITLLPDADPTEWDSFRWIEPPPVDCLERRMGRPHLTWIFVSPWASGQGFGTNLLAASVNALLGLGYKQLLSTFMLGNDSSMLWHWRTGFRLLSYPGSIRRIRGRNGKRG
jgi:hypothetical protein